MRFFTQSQFISALVVAAAWGCSSEPSDGTGAAGTTGNAAGTTGNGAGTGGTVAGGGSGGTVGGGLGGATGGTAPVAGAGGASGGAGGATPGGGAGGATGGSGGQIAAGGGGCDNLPGVKGHPDCAATYPTYTGFTLAMVEEFTAPIDLVNDPIWTYSDGGLDEGTPRFLKENIVFDTTAGTMKIEFKFPTDPIAGGFSYAEAKDVGLKEYSSGEFRTKYNNYRYGRYEVRFKGPAVTMANPDAPGGYVATMFIFRTPKIRQWREIDVEQTGYTATSLTTNLINGDNKTGWDGSFASATDKAGGTGTSARTEFHTYAFEWTAGRIDWFLDDSPTPFRTETGGGIPIPDMSAKIMMNLWAGSFGGDPNANEYPTASEYDWFRFYKWDTETTYPTANPAVDLPQTDRDASKNNPEDGVEDIPMNAGD